MGYIIVTSSLKVDNSMERDDKTSNGSSFQSQEFMYIKSYRQK